MSNSKVIPIACQGASEIAYNELEPFQGDLKTLDKEAFEKLRKDILDLGFSEPISVWQHEGHNYILNGHQRLRTLKVLIETEGYSCAKIPVNLVDATDIKQAKMKVLALASAFGRVESQGLYEFMTDAGITMEELETSINFQELPMESFKMEFFDDNTVDPQCDEEETPEPPVEPKTKRGDVYKLGECRLVCGDATSVDDVEKLMRNEKADVVFTDPPYNTGMGSKEPKKSGGPKGGSTRLSHMFDDSFTDEEWQSLMQGFCANYWLAMKDNAVAYICLDWRRNHELVPHIKNHFKLSNVIVWDKMVHDLGSDYKYTYELINVCKKGNPSMDTHQGDDREYSDVWHIQRKMGRDEEHATKKPIELVERAMRHSSKKGDLVLDLFGGSGSTMIAAVKNGRRCNMMEMDPKYCDVIVARWEKYTGQTAELLTSES
jgi:DNA modification methylase